MTERQHHILCDAYSDLMENLADYDALEVSGVANLNDGDDDTTYCEPCSDDVADFWSVYAHCLAGGVICIGDFETPALANAYADALSRKLDLPVTYRNASLADAPAALDVLVAALEQVVAALSPACRDTDTHRIVTLCECAIATAKGAAQ